MGKQEKPAHHESLVDFINLGLLQTDQFGSIVQALPNYFRVKYGFDELRRIKWGTISHIQYDIYLLGNIIQKACPNGDYSHVPRIKEAFEKRVEESTDEEMFEVCESLANRLMTGNPEEQSLYYHQMVKTYAGIRKNCAAQASAGLVLNTKILPHLETNKGILTAASIKQIISKEEHETLKRAYVYTRNISTLDIEEFNHEVLEQDKKRNVLHRDLLTFAERFMGKNDLRVFFDVLAEEQLRKGDLGLKGDIFYFVVGIKSLKNGPRSAEFAVYWPNAEKEFAEEIKRAYEYLKKAQNGEQGYGYIEYESRLGEKKDPESDEELFKQFVEKYVDYLKWEDAVVKYMHGDYLFTRRLAIDIKRIKERHADPGGFTEGIIDGIREIVGDKETYFLDFD